MGYKKNLYSFKVTILLCLLFTSSICCAEKKDSYVDGSVPFILIDDINRQGEAWATCAASYNIMSELIDSSLAQSKQMKELGNGASLSVTMAILAKDLKEDISPTKFKALLSFAQLAGTEWPKSHMTSIAADAERYEEKNIGMFFNKLQTTIDICIKNLDGQQVYVDMWRELAKSGLVQFQ